MRKRRKLAWQRQRAVGDENPVKLRKRKQPKPERFERRHGDIED